MKTRVLQWLLAGALLAAVDLSAFAVVSKVICVPWQGDPAKYHTAISGASAELKALIKTTDNTVIYYKWVFGDGTESSVVSLVNNTRYEVSTLHPYTGSAGTPFVARLLVGNNNALTDAIADNYLVKLEQNTLDARINIAIDRALWWLYQEGTYFAANSGNYTSSDNSQLFVWPPSNNSFAAPTASAIHAFQLNGHKESGNFDEDPYAEAVKFGFNWIFRGSFAGYPMLQALNIATEASHSADNPDSRPNGKGIEVRDWGYHPIYVGGQVMDAIIASGTPGSSSGRDFDGDGLSETYQQIVQDMCDMYAWGQVNPGDTRVGGWRYSWNSDADNSASQWAAIGMIPAQEAPWNCIVPTWVKTYNVSWLNWSKMTHGNWVKFGYNFPNQYIQPDYQGGSTTPSGMIQLSFDGITTSDARWIGAERWFAENWDVGEDWLYEAGGAYQNIYAAYAFTKAMRLAKPAPVATFAFNNFDWYYGNASHNGLAKVLSDELADGVVNITYWEGAHLATAWGVIILKPTLFAASPVACFSAHPNPTFSDLDVFFDPTCSGHSDPAKSLANIVKFEWDWDNNGTYDTTTTTPDVVTHAFHCTTVPCSFPVKLRVTDDENNTATFVQNINITDPPHPPVARLKSALVSLCPNDSLTLDGSLSFDPDEGLKESGCDTCPVDTITAWSWDLTGAPFTFTDGSGETLPVPNYSSFFPTPGAYNIGLRVTDNTALAYPHSGAPAQNLVDEQFGTVTVYAAGVCDLAATKQCGAIRLNWTANGADEYIVYRSFSGPNSDFTSVGSFAAPPASIPAVLGQTQWLRVMSRHGSEFKLSPAVSATLMFTDCVCITDLAARAKDRVVELNWTPYSGATCYNVYRSTSPNVPLVPANRIASCYATMLNGKVIYPDTSVINDTRYYYRVTAVSGGVEVCLSAEVNGLPTRPRR